MLGAIVLATLLAGITRYAHGVSQVLAFVLSAVALAGLAWIVSFATEQVGRRFGPAITGFLQSTLGNLPEFFVVIFALQAGQRVVAETAILGSILVNALLVLGLVIVAGARHAHDGVMRFSPRLPNDTATLLLVSSFIIILLGLANSAHDLASHHVKTISIVGAVAILIVYATWLREYLTSDSRPEALTSDSRPEALTSDSRPEALTSDPRPEALTSESRPEATTSDPRAEAMTSDPRAEAMTSDPRMEAMSEAPRISTAVSLVLLGGAGAASAFVSDWFVHALQPTINQLHLSQAFAGLVIVAIAGNAVENVAGIVLAHKGRADLAISVVKNSVAQIAAFLYPLLVLVSLLTATTLTFAIAPVYIGALFGTAVIVWQITGDGKATTFEGVALIASYVILAVVAAFEA